VRDEVPAPPAVKTVLERACYDCHSNRTVWPWYSRVAPVSWLVASDVHNGRHEVNFTDWPSFDQEDQDHILKHMVKQLERRKMPMPKYILMHPKARLTEDERHMLISWARME